MTSLGDAVAGDGSAWGRVMRVLLVAVLVLAALLVAGAGFGFWRYRQAFPAVSAEVVQLTPATRSRLERLRAEAKFGSHDYPPLGYTGAATPDARALASAAVDEVIDGVLSRGDGPVAAKTVSDLIGTGMRRVDRLDTEDRDRAADYMLEVWYLLGFKGATGRFAHGAAFPRPAGYAEPLPPGWKSPGEPRPIG